MEEVVEFLVEQHHGKFDLSSARGYNFSSLHKLLEHYRENPIIHRQTDMPIQITEVCLNLNQPADVKK